MNISQTSFLGQGRYVPKHLAKGRAVRLNKDTVLYSVSGGKRLAKKPETDEKENKTSNPMSEQNLKRLAVALAIVAAAGIGVRELTKPGAKGADTPPPPDSSQTEQVPENKPRYIVIDGEEIELDPDPAVRVATSPRPEITNDNDQTGVKDEFIFDDPEDEESPIGETGAEIAPIIDGEEDEEPVTIEQEPEVSKPDFDFEVHLTEDQEYALEVFKENWEQNKQRYYNVEAKTGKPAKLIAAIHWREAGCQFGRYLHDGTRLGNPVQSPQSKGKVFYSFEDSAIDILNCDYLKAIEVDEDDFDGMLNFAETYNGLGYRNMGVPSPYVWSGTDNYVCGKYTSDGHYNPNYVDDQLGVAVLISSIWDDNAVS